MYEGMRQYLEEKSYILFYKEACNIFIEDINYSEIIVCKIQLEEENKQKLIEDFESKKVNLIDLKYLSKKIINKCIIK